MPSLDVLLMIMNDEYEMGGVSPPLCAISGDMFLSST